MGSTQIVVVQPGRQGGLTKAAELRVGSSVGPFTEQRLDKSLGLSVGLGGVGAGQASASRCPAGVGEDMRAVTVGIISEHAANV